MSEMIDRVARAIAEHQHLAWLYDERTTAPCDPEKLAVARAGLFAAAHAAFRAMRELPGDPGPRYNAGEYSRKNHEAMIDDALA